MLAVAIITSLTAGAPLAADLAIVIDDVGYNKSRGLRAINLPGDMTIAVLPHAPHTTSLVAHAVAGGKDVIIHQPMEPHPGPEVREEPGTLKLNMSTDEFDSLVIDSLDTVPERSGLSNHTGSLLTQAQQPMRRLMAQLRKRNLYFLDSRTSAGTVAVDVAREMGVPALKRDVFLDHYRTIEKIDAAFNKALRVARRKGFAILVGHPYPVSLDFLEERLLDLPPDIRLVSAADLARRRVTRPLVTHRGVLAQPVGPGSPHILLGR